jgi:hypothetical protein
VSDAFGQDGTFGPLDDKAFTPTTAIGAAAIVEIIRTRDLGLIGRLI